MAWFGGQYAVTASAVNVTTALSLVGGDLPSGGRHARKITIKNAAGAANTAYLGPSTVTNVPVNARVELAAGQAFTFGPFSSSHSINTDEVYMVGTANAANILFIAIEV